MAESVACDPRVLAAIEAHARRDAPRECCGLLMGRDDCIEEAEAVPNRAGDPLRRYEIDPRDLLAAIKRCRGTPATVVGAYHSHPRSAAEPSPTDGAEAFGGFLYLIAGPVREGAPVQIHAYRLENGNFLPVRLVPDPKERQT